jgi:chromosome segregation ATPase
MPGDGDLDMLRDENAELKREVAKLSEEMDRIQHRRHAKHKGNSKYDATDSKLQLVNAEVRIAIQQNEDLRRERLKLTAEVAHSDTGRRIAEAKNELAVVERKIAATRDEIKALEFQKKGRKDIVEMAHHTEEEIRLFRSQHRDELTGFKEEAHALTEEQKTLDRQMIAMQEKIHKIQEKIKLGVDGPTFQDLKNKVAHQDEEIAQLREEVAHVSGSLASDTKRENSALKNLRDDRTRYNDRIAELKQTLIERERELKLSYNLTKTALPVKPLSPPTQH